jgi:hypothetical protein
VNDSLFISFFSDWEGKFVLITLSATIFFIAFRHARRNRVPAAKLTIIVGAVAFILCGLFPPWLSISSAGHAHATGCSFILSPPTKGNSKLDISRLAVEWLCIAVAAGTVWLLVSKPKKATGNGQEKPDKPAKP